MELKEVTDADELISLWSDVAKSDNQVTPASVIMARMLNGEYRTVKGVRGDCTTAFVVFRVIDTHIYIVWLYATELNGFPKLFWEKLKELGYKTVEAMSTRSVRGFEKVTGLTRQYTVYGKEL